MQESYLMAELNTDFATTCEAHRDYFETQILLVAKKALGEHFEQTSPNMPEWLISAFHRLLRLGELDQGSRATLKGTISRIFRKCLAYVHDRVSSEERGTWEVNHRFQSSLKGGTTNPHDERITDMVHLVSILDQFEDLDPELAELIDLKFFLGMTLDEISIQKNLTIGQVDARIKKALKELKKYI